MADTTTVQLKVLIYKTLQTQKDFVKFLKKAADRYGHLLNEQEAYEGAILMQRASETIDWLDAIMDTAIITLSDASYHPKRSDDKLPEPPPRPCYVLGTRRMLPTAVTGRDMDGVLGMKQGAL